MTSANLNFSGLSKLEKVNTSRPRGAPGPGGQANQQAVQAAATEQPQPAKLATNVTQEVNSHAGGKGHLTLAQHFKR